MKNFISYKILLFISILNFSFSSNPIYNHFPFYLGVKSENSTNSTNSTFYLYLRSFLKQFSNSTIEEKYFKGDCEKSMMDSLDESEEIFNFYYYSGKKFDDWGDYTECTKNDFLYIQFRYSIIY